MNKLVRAVPELRIRAANYAPVRTDGEYILYWMTAFRRPYYNFSLSRAVELAEGLGKPLVVFEALRLGYRWASDRLHRFVIDGMAANQRAFANKPVVYYPYVEPAPNAAKGLLEAFAQRAAVVVTDDFPCFFLPRLISVVAPRLSVRLEAIDSNGLLPLRAADRVFDLAHSFRRFLHKALPLHLEETPERDPLVGSGLPALVAVPNEISSRWPPASARLLAGAADELAGLAIDHRVGVVNETPGGWDAGARALATFMTMRLPRYGEERNEPDDVVTSQLSPYLHFGFVSPHEIFAELTEKEEWTPERLAARPTGAREGWWGMSPNVEAFLDELVTWRELGYNMTSRSPDYDRYDSLPEWAKRTLADHAEDPRPALFSLEQLEASETYDALWNAAQRQLVRDGRIHNYMRMLWGKKVLEWTRTPQEALAVLLELNNKYALDGRNPNSYSGIFWIFGRYDRAWGPERPIFGKIRYMTSENTARKYSVKGYLWKYGPGSKPQ